MANRLRLPEDVVLRLGDKGLAAVSAFSGPHVLEARLWSGVELRVKDGDTGVRVVGYASTYDQPYPIWGGAANGGFDETIAAGAFDKSVREKDDVRFLVNHDGVPLARTKSGTMTLEADDVGLLVDADLDPTSPIVAGLRSAMERGDMDQMSFAFEVTRQTWSPDYSQRTITEVKLYDVSVVTYPANDQTMALVGADALRPAAVPPSDPAAGRGLSIHLARAQWYRLTA
jgi:HK97 family phage prohead protease